MYRKVKTDFKFQEREHEVLKFWKENDIFRKSMEQRKGAPEYTFFDGPPTANGTPHIGHVLTRAIKDLIPRYQTMKGNHVLRRPAGIPTGCRWNWKWKNFWGWMARNRSRNTAWSLLSRSVKKAFGNMKTFGVK